MKIKYLLPALLLALVIGCTTQKITPAKPATPTSPAVPAVTNWIVDPRLDATLGTIGDINKATAPVNPFAPLVDIGLGAAALVAAWVAKRKNDANAQNALLLKTVVQAVDGLDQQPVKDAIQAHAARVGVEGELNQVVKSVGSGLL
jgi:hypothetical protein